MEYEIQMDEKIEHQPLIPPRIKTHNPVSNLCTLLSYRIFKRIKSSYGLDINDTNTLEDSPLHSAAKLGREQEVALLLSSGANASTKGMFKRTPLHWAASNGFSGVITLLIVHGTCIHCKD